MKVRDLTKKLADLDPNLEVYCYEEGPFPIPSAYPGPYELYDISVVDVHMSRDRGGKPLIEFGTDGTRRVAILGITSDF